MKKALHRRLKKGISIVAACAIMATNFSPWLATAYAGEMPEEALYEGADEFYEAAPAVTETPEETQALSAASAEASYEVSAEPTETPDAAEPTEALATAEATEAPDENGIADVVSRAHGTVDDLSRASALTPVPICRSFRNVARKLADALEKEGL